MTDFLLGPGYRRSDSVFGFKIGKSVSVTEAISDRMFLC